MKPILLCDMYRTVISEYKTTTSPIQCLDLALESDWNIVIVSYLATEIRDRIVLTDLCRTLTRHDIPVLALMELLHRSLLQELYEAGVPYTSVLSDLIVDQQLQIPPLESLPSLEKTYKNCCPYINYIYYDDSEEMVVCGANLDRLVLGKKKQFELCTNSEHTECCYFNSPRVKK